MLHTYKRALRGGLACLLAALLLCGQVSCTTPNDPADTATDTVTDTLPDTEGSTDTVADTVADTDADTAPEADTEIETNDETLAPVVNTATLSHSGGVYTASVTLTATAPEGTTLRYTKDGSIPTSRSRKFPASLTVAETVGKADCIRVAAFDGSTMVGSVATHTYVRRKSDASALHVVMISVDEEHLDEMCAAPYEKIERPAHVEIVTPEGKTVVSQDAGLRLFGGSSRTLSQKSFKLIARKDGYFGDVAYVGRGTFRYPLFEDRTVLAGENAGEVLDRYDSFILRNGGNDSFQSTACDPMDAALLRDGVINNFAATYAPNVAVSLSQFAAVYINGEYYGLLDMRENQNEDYVKRVWGVDDADVVVIKSELDTSRHCDRHESGSSCRFCGVWFYYETDEDAAAQAEMTAWEDLCRRAAEAANASETIYRALFEEVSSKVDLQNLMEYLALNLYFCNTDWPHNNVKVWRYTGAPVEGVAITDGKWRFMTRDMDMAAARYSSPDVLPELDSRAKVDTFWRCLGNYVDGYSDFYANSDETRLYPDALYLQGLFAFCLRDQDFRRDFVAYARTLASDAAVELQESLYSESYAQIKADIDAHLDRWGNDIAGGITEKRDWYAAARRVKTFFGNRPRYFLEHLALADRACARMGSN